MHSERDWSEVCKQRVHAAGSDWAETVTKRAATAARMVNFMILKWEEEIGYNEEEVNGVFWGWMVRENLRK